MKVLTILAFVLVVAATAVAYAHVGMPGGVTAIATATPEPSEPTTLLFYGGALLAAAGALRRYTV